MGTGNAKLDGRKTAFSKTRHYLLDFPTHDAAGPGDSRRGTFDNLIQLLFARMDRCKTDAFIYLVEWSEEVNHQLKKLNWTGVSIEDNFKIEKINI